MNNILVSLICFIFSGGQFLHTGSPAALINPAYKSSLLPSFEKLSEGRITFDLFIPESEETQIINLISTDNVSKEIVFSLPLISGNALYPHNISPEAIHSFILDFDLSYNFCKVYIDGNWLTTLLARKQYYYINGIDFIVPSGNASLERLTRLHTDGSKSDFTTPVRIVALGASTTATRKTITGVFCQRMPEYFKKSKIPVQIFNEGIGGSHSGRLTDNSRFKIKHALDRFDEAVIAKDPDFVIINFGINDSWIDSDDPDGESRISLTKYRENILYMVKTLKEREVQVILLTPNALGKNIAHWRSERTEKYVRVLREIARKEDLAFIDQWKLMNKIADKQGKEIDDFLMPDSMHTNDQWHQVSAETISELIIHLISERGN